LTDKPIKNTRGKKLGILVILGLLAITGLVYFLMTRGRETTDDAFIDGRIYSISPRVPGYVVEVLVEENQAVKEGQILVRLDVSEYEVALAAARASLAEAEANLASLELGVPLELNQTEQRVRGAKAQLAGLERTREGLIKEEEAAAADLQRASAERQNAFLDLKRIQELKKKGVVSASEEDAVATRAKSAQALMSAASARRDRAGKQLASVTAEMDSLRANVELAATGEDQADIRVRQVEAGRARVELAQAQVRQAELNLDFATVRASSTGHVTRKSVEPGQMVSRGQPLLAIVPLDTANLWVTANFKETQLTDVKPGQKVTMKVDAFPGVTINGRVESIMSGTGAVFSLFPPENASGNFVKVVQRVPVKIVFENNNQLPDLRIGLSVVPTIHTTD
jgi:membrane fusion protein (multidrug efflux system)